MSQPVITTMFAFVIAIVLTTTIAMSTFADNHAIRAVKVTIRGAVIAIAAVTLVHLHVRINFTSSMPIGIYSLSRLPPDRLERGMLVALCAPARAAEVGQRRGYLARGPCASDTESLLKSVAAVAGDEVDVTAAGVLVNGCLLPRSQPVAHDDAGRDLVPWPPGRFRLGSDQVWLYAANTRSWDSRYWGPALGGNIEARALPLLMLPGASVLPVVSVGSTTCSRQFVSRFSNQSPLL